MDTTPIKMAMELRSMMLVLSSFGCTFAIMLMAYRKCFANAERVIRSIVFVSTVVGCMSIYPRAVIDSADLITTCSQQEELHINKGLDQWSKISISGEDGLTAIKEKIISAFYSVTIGLSKLMREFLTLIQREGLYILIALSPILFMTLLIPEVSDIGVKFIMVTLGVVLWSVGFCLSDMMIFAGWQAIVLKALSSPGEIIALGGGAVAAALISAASITTALPVLIISLAITICLYFLCAIIIFNIMGIVILFSLLSGGNPIASALSAVTATTSTINMGVNAARSGVNLHKKISGGLIGAGGKVKDWLSKNARGLGEV